MAHQVTGAQLLKPAGRGSLRRIRRSAKPDPVAFTTGPLSHLGTTAYRVYRLLSWISAPPRAIQLRGNSSSTVKIGSPSRTRKVAAKKAR